MAPATSRTSRLKCDTQPARGYSVEINSATGLNSGIARNGQRSGLFHDGIRTNDKIARTANASRIGCGNRAVLECEIEGWTAGVDEGIGPANSAIVHDDAGCAVRVCFQVNRTRAAGDESRTAFCRDRTGKGIAAIIDGDTTAAS